MTKTFRFQKFPVYKDIKDFIRNIFVSTSKFPKEYQYDLSSQIRKAAISILLNIAEGSGRGSDKEFNRFIMIAMVSIDGVIAGLDLALELTIITTEKYKSLYEQADSIKRQLGGLSKALIKGCKL